ncbi:MAG: hypothetical protein HY647_01405 [Acidobacteria bacterium]|nr:hypothetical protein [Acidobacteriota bacterium]
MYFWNVRVLTEDLKANKVSQREIVEYVVAWIAAGPILNLLDHWLPVGSPGAAIDWIYSYLCPVMAIVGTIVCFDANKRGDNKAFIERLACILWPITIRATVVWLIPALIVYWLVFVFLGVIESFIQSEKTIPSLLLLASYQIVIYLWARTQFLKMSVGGNTLADE